MHLAAAQKWDVSLYMSEVLICEMNQHDLRMLLRLTGTVILTQICPAKHVKHTSWCAHHYVRGLSLELLYFGTETGSANAGMAACPHVVTQGQNDLLDLMRGEEQKKNRKKTAVQDNEKRA